MKLDLKRFSQACNPTKTLVIAKPEDRQYYIDFSQVRGGKIIEELQRTITRLSPEKPTCQLFTGHIGCGKSTELLRLKAELEQENFHVVYFESSQSLDMADIDVTDILLAIAREVSQSLEAIKISIKPKYFQKLFTEIGDLLKTEIDLKGLEFSVGFVKIATQTKDSPTLRNQLRQYLEPRTNGILESINKELLQPIQEKLKQQGKEGLLVIVDNLDRVHNVVKTPGNSLSEYLFIQRGEQLKNLDCHIVYTIPLDLIFSNGINRLKNTFGTVPKVLPMVPVQLKDGSDFNQGIVLLKQMIMSRAFPGVSWEQSQHLVTQVFDSPDTLERLCRISGGHLRNLLMLLYGCLQKSDPPIARGSLESVIKDDRNTLTLAIKDDEWELLRKVAKSKTIKGHEEYDMLIRDMFVFEYRDENGSWFNINPTLAEAPEFNL